MIIYALLFLTAFAAATVLPLSSEVAVIAAVRANHNVLLIWLFASTGNILGSVVNWGLGRYIEQFKSRSWFPFSSNDTERAQIFFKRYGNWSLLFAWLPVIGDALTLIAGIMRMNFYLFALLVTISKSVRYGLIIFAVKPFF